MLIYVQDCMCIHEIYFKVWLLSGRAVFFVPKWNWRQIYQILSNCNNYVCFNDAQLKLMLCQPPACQILAGNITYAFYPFNWLMNQSNHYNLQTIIFHIKAIWQNCHRCFVPVWTARLCGETKEPNYIWLYAFRSSKIDFIPVWSNYPYLIWYVVHL